MDEKIDLGYLTVSRRALTGAVSTVSGEVLDKSPESNLGKTFAGRFSGMITMEKDAELGQGTKSSTSNAIIFVVRVGILFLWSSSFWFVEGLLSCFF